MEALGTLKDGDDAKTKLEPLLTQYRAWIEAQRGTLAGLEPRQRRTAEDLLLQAGVAADRIEAGVAALGDPEVLDAFRIANRTMGQAARQREAVRTETDAAQVAPPQ